MRKIILAIGLLFLGAWAHADPMKIINSSGVYTSGGTQGAYAPSGFTGSVISSATSAQLNFPSSGSYGDLLTITLTPGNWLVLGAVDANYNGATVSFTVYGVGTTSGDNPPSGNTCRTDTATGPTATNNITTPASNGCTFSVTTNTNIYLKYRANYTVATPKANGSFIAIRLP